MLLIRFAVLAAVLATMSAPVRAVLERPWSGTFLPPYGRMVDVAALDRYYFYAAGENGSILQSEDGGRAWSPVAVVEGTSGFRAIDADHSLGVVAVGAGGVVTQFHPGMEPVTRTLNAEWDLTGVAMENGVILISGTDENGRPLILRSEDGGQHYDMPALPIGVPSDVAGVRFLGVATAVVYGSLHQGEGSGKAMILVSQDAGKTWSESLRGAEGFVVTAIERTSLHWVAVGFADSESAFGLYRSTDEGQSWTFEQQHDLAMVTDLVRGDGPELIAVGIRVIDADPEPVVMAAEFFSLDLGRNWGIRDIAEVDVPFIRLGRGGDRILAVGFETDVYRRFYDAEPSVRDLLQIRKHLPLGVGRLGTAKERTFADVVVNRSESTIRVVGATMHGLEGCTVLSPLPNDDLAPGQPLSIVLANAPRSEGEAWGVLSVAFSNDTIVDFMVSTYGQVVNTNSMLVADIPVADLGNVVGTEVVQQQFDVVRNAGVQPVTITGVTMTGGDQLVFAWAGVWEFPFDLQPGEVLPIDLMFEPVTTGTYHALLEVHTPDGTVVVPVVASSRETTWEHVIDMGTTSVGQQVETAVEFRHMAWNTSLDLVTVNGPSSPFAVVSTSGLPFYGVKPGDAFTVTLGLEGSAPGRFASLVSVPWSYTVGASMREDRRVVVGRVDGATGVDEKGALANLEISPQPAADWVRISLPEGLLWSDLSIVDLQGRVLVQQQLAGGQAAAQLDVQALPSGMYQVVARHSAGVVTRAYLQQ